MSPCRKCSAQCCKYFALQIDTPRSRDDFENLRWYIAHQKTHIFSEKRKWYLEITKRCRYLTKDNLCKIYDTRPAICREHSARDCEFTHGEAEHDLYFKSLPELDAYLKERFKKTKKKSKTKK